MRPEQRIAQKNRGESVVLQSARHWTQMVLAEHEQSERVMADLPPKDFWSGLSHRFVPPRPGEGGRDETLEALLAVVRPEHTVMDVGAGAGRLAVPLSRHCRTVTAVEPSEAMRGRLTQMAEVWEASNLRVIPERWEDASPDPADIVLCAHVVYTVTDIELFTAKLDNFARELVAVILFEKPAAANYFPLWAKVHGEERLALPCSAGIHGRSGGDGRRLPGTAAAPLGAGAPRRHGNGRQGVFGATIRRARLRKGGPARSSAPREPG